MHDDGAPTSRSLTAQIRLTSRLTLRSDRMLSTTQRSAAAHSESDMAAAQHAVLHRHVPQAPHYAGAVAQHWSCHRLRTLRHRQPPHCAQSPQLLRDVVGLGGEDEEGWGVGVGAGEQGEFSDRMIEPVLCNDVHPATPALAHSASADDAAELVCELGKSQHSPAVY